MRPQRELNCPATTNQKGNGYNQMFEGELYVHGVLNNGNEIMSHLNSLFYSDSPRRIFDALPLSTCREGKSTPQGGLGVSELKYDMILF